MDGTSNVPTPTTDQGQTFNPWADVVHFHKCFGLYGPSLPTRIGEPLFSTELFAFRYRFIKEEMGELETAMLKELLFPGYQIQHRADQLDAICDLIYVLLGYAYLRGWDVPAAWSRVQQANMTKMRVAPDDPRARSRWDVVKPPGFVPPKHDDLVV